MYEFLSGKIVRKDPTRLILEVGGVGYELLIPLSTFRTLGAPGEKVQVMTHFLVREDEQRLIGFKTEDERAVFRLLLSVTGIGPKMALTILSGIGTAELKKAIIEGSLHVLTSISGIGKKTAERLVIELREKMLLLDPRAKAGAGSVSGISSPVVEDSLQALVSLGYRRPEAKQALEKVLEAKQAATFSLEELIRASLKHI